MGRALLVCRLAARDIRHHAAQAVLLLLAISAATTVLTIGLALHGVTSRPYQQTRAATSGPDVVATLPAISRPGGPPPQVPAAQAMALIHAAGVIGHSGPYPMASAIVHAHGHTAGVEAEGRTQAPAAVDQPKLTAGSWVRPGGVVIERTFAEALGTVPGDRITMNGRPFTVAGIAITAAVAPYPNICYSGCELTPYLGSHGISARRIGLIWTTEPDARALASAANPLTGYVLDLKLRHPAAARAFAGRYGPTGPLLMSWQDIAAADGLLVQDEQQVLEPGAVLLSLLAVASVAVLVGGRLAEQKRRVGLLKAVGGTPGLIAATFLAENLALALIAAATGLLAGWLAAPLLTSPGAALVGRPGAPSLTPPAAVVVVGVALTVALAATLIPAVRAARSSTVRALADAARPPRRSGVLIRISRPLPVPLWLGLRLAARRPRRSLLSAASIFITATGIVTALAFHATAREARFGGSTGLTDPVVTRDGQMLLVLSVMLFTLAALNAVFTCWSTVLDARHPTAVARALGVSPRQVSAGLAVAQLLPAVPGVIAGIPAGIGLFAAANRSGLVTVPPAWWLVAAALGILLVLAALTAVPAQIGAHRPVAEVLGSETG